MVCLGLLVSLEINGYARTIGIAQVKSSTLILIHAGMRTSSLQITSWSYLLSQRSQQYGHWLRCSKWTRFEGMRHSSPLSIYAS